jgi:hypothetical protein
VHSVPENTLVVVGDPAPPPPSPGPAVTAPSAGNGTRPTTASTPRTSALPNSRKGYKLTLVVSPTTEAGLADAHGMLQLDGADPIPFCRLKDVQNPLARALQEAFLAVERVRAKPPKMAAPSTVTVPAASPAPSPTAPRPTQKPPAHSRSTPGVPSGTKGSAVAQRTVGEAKTAGAPASPKQAAPVDQPALF